MEGFVESSFGIEFLSTVHWFLVHHAPESLEAMVDQIHGWNKRKNRFSPEQIALAAGKQGWTDSTVSLFTV